MSEIPEIGKISPEIFNELIFPRLGAKSEKVLVGPQHGVDVGIVEIGDKAVSFTCDPVFIVPEYGWERAACVNIVPRVNSLFRWQGKVDSAQESLLIIKSIASLLPKIVEMVKRAHSYEVPEIIALPIISGNEDYLKWMDSEVGEA